MSAAALADDLGPAHPVRRVVPDLDRLGELRLGEARPARAGVELRLGVEQLRAAGGAAVDAVLVVVPVLAGERALGALLAQHLVLLGRELLAPLGVGLLNLGGHAFRVRRAPYDAKNSASAACVSRGRSSWGTCPQSSSVCRAPGTASLTWRANAIGTSLSRR